MATIKWRLSSRTNADGKSELYLRLTWSKDGRARAGSGIFITATETKTRTEGGKLTTTRSEKWQLVTSHTGRRSFATNMYKRGLPSIMIMSITGHKTESAFLKYIKVRQEEHAEMMADIWRKIYE